MTYTMIEKTQPMPAPPVPATTKEERTWAMATHLSSLIAIFGVPFGNVFGPLVFWLIKKDQFPFVDDQGKESLNFQLSMTIYAIGALLLSLILIGIPILLGIFVYDFIMVIIASVHASDGRQFRYPLTIRLIT
jgi:uncharacterized Tic20 family protein